MNCSEKEFEMRSYEAARNLFGFLGICSWAVIAFGAILAFSGGTIVGTGMGRNASGLSALMGAAPGFILAMLGFYGLALVQMGRAGVDSAEYAQQSLDLSRQQLELSKQALEQGKAAAASYASLKSAKKAQKKPKSAKKDAADGPSYATRSDKTETAPVPAPPNPRKKKSVPIAETAAATTTVVETKPPTVEKALSPPEPVVTVDDILPVEPDPEPIEPSIKSDKPTLNAQQKSAPKEANTAPPAFVGKVSPPPAPKEIRLVDGKYTYGKLTFESEESAKRYVSQFGVNPNVNLSDA